MLNPVQIKPFEGADHGWTIIQLHIGLLIDDEFALVKKKLSELRPQMLLFTRRLKELEIYLEDSPLPRVASSDSIRFHVRTHVEPYGIVTLESSISGSRMYFVHEYIITNMPDHPKRQSDDRKSKIILAFPCNDSGPIIEQQDIFAFLPLHRTPLPVSQFDLRR